MVLVVGERLGRRVGVVRVVDRVVEVEGVGDVRRVGIAPELEPVPEEGRGPRRPHGIFRSALSGGRFISFSIVSSSPLGLQSARRMPSRSINSSRGSARNGTNCRTRNHQRRQVGRMAVEPRRVAFSSPCQDRASQGGGESFRLARSFRISWTSGLVCPTQRTIRSWSIRTYSGYPETK